MGLLTYLIYMICHNINQLKQNEWEIAINKVSNKLLMTLNMGNCGICFSPSHAKRM